MPVNRFLLLVLCWGFCPIFPYAQNSHTRGFSFNPYSVDEGNGIILQTLRISCERTRPESRTILLIHGGGPGDIASFDFHWNDSDPFATDLAEMGFTVYLMDVRGWEGSTAPAYSLTDTAITAGSCQEAAQDIDAVVDYIRKTEHIDRVNLFGWATGGHWASYYTTLHNDKVDNLIVLNTLYGVKAPWGLSSAFADPADSNRYNNHLAVYRESRQQDLIDARLNAVPFADKNDWIDTSGLRNYAETVTMWSKQHVLRVPGGYRKESFYMAHGHQYWNARDIKRPVLILRSQYDFWSRPIDATTFYQDLVHSPRKSSMELKEATHFVFLDSPAKGRQQLLDAIDRFIPRPPPYALTIDSLRTDAQVLEFIQRFEFTSNRIFLVPPRPMSVGAHQDSDWRRQFGAASWEKADFDGNGTTDLLVNGYSPSVRESSITNCFVLLNFGRDSFRIIRLFSPSYEFIVAKELPLDGHADIVILNGSPHVSDTLTYRFGNFIERMRPSPPIPIREIRYCAWGFFSPDPGYGFTIHGDSIRYVRPPSVDLDFHYRDNDGIYLARLDTATAEQLYSLINYLDIPSLRRQYSVPWTDAGMFTLKIDYQNGTSVRIDDGGGLGTFGLSALYQLLSAIRNSQHWTRIASVPPSTSPCQ
jgi:pimeloyl-ACP methyl ester carboxylesterase